MRKTTLSILMLSLVAVVMTSCNLFKNEQERKIVGKWYISDAADAYQDTATVIDDYTTLRIITEETCTYEADKKINSTGTFQYVISLYDEYSIILKYRFSSAGTWEIKDDRLYEKYSDASINFAGMELSHPNDPDLQQLANQYKQNFAADVMPELKSDFLTPNDYKIVKVDDNELILSDKEGTTSSYRRLN